MKNFEYDFRVDTPLNIAVWCEDALLGLTRYRAHIAHDGASFTEERKGYENKINLTLREANHLLSLICKLNPKLGNPVHDTQYWMQIESPSIKLEYKWAGEDEYFENLTNIKNWMKSLRGSSLSLSDVSVCETNRGT